MGQHDTGATACDLGTPDAQGVTVRGTFARVGQVRAYQFLVGGEPRTGQIYLGDLWYEVGMTLWRTPSSDEGPAGWPCDPARGCVAESARSERRSLQFLRPKTFLERLEPGAYTVLVSARDEAGFDSSRGFTLRVALGPPVCAIQDEPAFRYRLGLTMQPSAPGPFDLVTFSAVVSPPYSDLFDFAWQIDGQPFASVSRETIQRAASDLSPTAGGEHRILVTARGVRPYPDSDQPDVPPTLTAECTFRVS